MQCNHPITRRRKDGSPIRHRCGQCIGCRVTINQEWAFRLLLEAQHTEGLSLFGTLTYTDKYIPRTASGLPTVRKDDVRQFIHTLRRNTRWKLKYFAPTEYGKQGGRPHAHFCLFLRNPTMPARLWEPRGENRQHLADKNIRWKDYGVIEREILRAWGCKGAIQVAPLTQTRAAYLAKYLSKQATDPRSLHPEQEPEGFTMTPGLGAKGAEAMAEHIRQMGGTMIELQKPGVLVDASTWTINRDYVPFDHRNRDLNRSKTYPVARFLRDKIIHHLGGQSPEFDKAGELEFQEHLRRLRPFVKDAQRAEKFERFTRRKLARMGEL